MNRYLLFQGDDYYPTGGAGDFSGAFATLEDATRAPLRGGWAHIARIENNGALRIVAVYDRSNGWKETRA